MTRSKRPRSRPRLRKVVGVVQPPAPMPVALEAAIRLADDKDPKVDGLEWVKCTGCGRLMLKLKDTRKVCMDCIAKSNKAVDLKAEEERWNEERRKWADEERRLWLERGVG